jgi:hypothetical protein
MGGKQDARLTNPSDDPGVLPQGRVVVRLQGGNDPQLGILAGQSDQSLPHAARGSVDGNASGHD